MNLIGTAIAQVLLQESSRANKDGTLSLLIEEVFEKLVALGMLPYALLVVVGGELFPFVFGSE
ncbi:MAG: lipopolysaccharide biosynthesis protein, partial [Deltaproteobacteria bacterium]|nr:lipopolysaccharide biosynthesis protein [Deltaproteobacteria bacterium]